ncbi:MAG: nucleoside hydrolase, partial [Planctomycetes bacterium]|nr:nucleoside hydrolase [Planctomycetota bacterium]
VTRAVTGLLTFLGRGEPDARSSGAPLHDPCVIAYLLKPDLFKARRAHVTVETADEATVGRTTVAWGAEEPNARVIEDLDADGFFALVCWSFVSMVDPALEGWERFSAISASCLPEIIPCAAMFLGGINTFFLCLVYATARVRWSRPTFLKIVAPVIFVVVALLVLWVVVTR